MSEEMKEMKFAECSGRGECWQQCCCSCSDSDDSEDKGDKTESTPCKGTCEHAKCERQGSERGGWFCRHYVCKYDCELKPCPDCGDLYYQWLFDCHGGRCMKCAIGSSGKQYTDIGQTDIKTKSDPENDTCDICGKSIYAAWLVDHKNSHFADANIPFATNDQIGVRRFKVHNNDYSLYTAFGQCLILVSYLNSDFPTKRIDNNEINWNILRSLSYVRTQFANALKKSPIECIKDFHRENDNVTMIIPELWRDENHIRAECEAFLRTIATEAQK